MAMMYPVLQPFGAESASVKGRRKTIRPQAKRIDPGTEIELVLP
jgi:hypothetical protein